MLILDILRTAGHGTALADIVRSHDLSPEQLDAIVATVVPALAQRLEANTLSRGGLADLLVEMARPDHVRLFDHPDLATADPARAGGIAALNTVFGDKAASRALAARAAATSGVNQDVIQRLLPILASLVMGALAKGSRSSLNDILQRLPTAPPLARRRGPPTRGTPVGDVAGRAPVGPIGTSGQPSTHDSPLPLPGDPPRRDVPDVDPDRPSAEPPSAGPTLPDIVRDGRARLDGDPIAAVVRNVLGTLMGFQSKGVMGWLVRFLVVRYGWGILQAILRRVLSRA